MTKYSGREMLTIAAMLIDGITNSKCGKILTSSRSAALKVNAMTKQEATKAAGIAQRGAFHKAISHTPTMRPASKGSAARFKKGFVQYESKKPASIACAISPGILETKSASGRIRPVAINNTPVSMNAPMAWENNSLSPSLAAKAPAMSAAPGVDQAMVMGALVVYAKK